VVKAAVGAPPDRVFKHIAAIRRAEVKALGSAYSNALTLDEAQHAITLTGHWWYKGTHTVNVHPEGSEVTYSVSNAARRTRTLAFFHKPLLDRRVSTGMPVLRRTVRIMRHVVNRGDRYGKLAVIAEVQKAGTDGRRYRAALCRCECGKEVTPRISSLESGDAQSCGCSRGQPKSGWRRCPVCGSLAVIRRDRRSCSRACGYELARLARQAANPSYAVWHHRINKARGPASGYACADCGGPAQDWSTVNPRSDDVQARFQPRCRKCHRSYDGAVGEGSPRAKLTDDKVRRLRVRRADGVTYRQLAAEFGISDVSAWAAVNGRTWAHVKQGLRFGPRDDVLRERTDQAGDMADRLVGDTGRAEGRDEMTGGQIEVFLSYPAPPVCRPHGRTRIRVGAAKRRGEELDLPALELGHVRSREKPGEFRVAGDTHIEIVNHGDQGRFSADGIVDARSRSGAHCWLLKYVSAHGAS
jgi:hypothetical protein